MLLGVTVLFFSECIFSPSKQKKQDNSPQIISVNISDGAIVTARDITVIWEGNKAAEFYQYTVDGISYGWTDTTSVHLTDLDEDEHIFTIQARKDSVFSPFTFDPQPLLSTLLPQ